MGIEEDVGICALLQRVCDVWMRWPLSLRAPVGEVQRAAVWGGVRVRGPQDHDHPTLTTQGSKCRQRRSYGQRNREGLAQDSNIFRKLVIESERRNSLDRLLTRFGEY